MSDLTLIPTRFAPVVPHDTSPVNTTLGLYINVAGNIVVTGADGVAVTLAVGPNQYLSGKFALVKATGTTATGITALYA